MPWQSRRGTEHPAVSGASGQVAQVFGTDRAESAEKAVTRVECPGVLQVITEVDEINAGRCF
jgi:hypothetical protein